MSLIPKMSSDELNRILEEIQEFKNDSTGLLNSLMPHGKKFCSYEKMLRQGVQFWSMSKLPILIRDNNQITNILLPPTTQIEDETQFFLRLETLTTSSTIFCTWISLVFLRMGKVIHTIEQLPNKPPHLTAYLNLAKCKDIRHIRNAISHGTFNAEYQVLEFVDRNTRTNESVEGRISFPELNQVNEHFFTLWTSVWAATLKHIND
jgi:hypothetical protein